MTAAGARLALLTAVLTAVGGTLAAFVAAALGLRAGSSVETMATSAVVLRAVLVTCVLLLAARGMTRRGVAGRVPGTEAAVLAGALAGGLVATLLGPGHVLVAQLFVEQAAIAAVTDLLLWMAVAGFGLFWGSSSATRPSPPVTPYG